MFNYGNNVPHLMSTPPDEERKLWVLVSSMQENTSDSELQRIAPQMGDLVDQAHSRGIFMWSGPLDNEKTGMAVFEATEHDAQEFFEKNKKICSGVLDTYLYRWGALPFLSVL